MFDRIRKSLKGRASVHQWLPVAVVASLFIPAVLAQPGPGFNTTVPSQIVDQFRNQRIQWTTNIWVYANALFGILAVIEFAWSAAVMLLEKSDLQSWTSALVRKLMWIGAFYALLLNGRIWIPAIIDSFTQIGQNAAGVGALSPSDVFMQGLGIAGALLDGASTSAFFTNPGTSLALAFAALLIVVSYTMIAINFIVTLVESYLVVSVGFIFLGFGGSRWTAPYTERYIGLAVSIGIKIILLYCLISAGLGLSLGWLDEAQGIATSARPAMTAFDVMGGSLIFMMCCWQIPKLFAAVLGGSPALTGGDLVTTAAVVGSAALAVGGNAVAGTVLVSGSPATATGSAAGAGGAGSGAASAVASVGSVGSGSSTGGGSVPPPSGSTANGWVTRRQPDPPANVFGTTQRAPSVPSALSSIGGEPLAGSGFESESFQRGFAPASVDPSEGTTSSGASSPSDTVSPESSAVLTDVTSAGSARPASSPPPAIAGDKGAISRVADQVGRVRRRLGSLPSDAAPHATPPRIPIEHEE